MDSRFLKFCVLFYAYNKYSERHCGIYLRFTCIFGDMSRAGIPVLKTLSVKLQKRDLDVYEAYTNSNNVTDDLQDIRDNIEDIWTDWFDLAVTTAENVGVVPSIPRRTNQQQHRDNVPAQTPADYYKRAVAISLLDHLQSEMKTYFNPTNDAVLSSLFNLLPELVALGETEILTLKQRWSFMRTTFLLLMWLMLSPCDGRESGVALRMPTFPPVQFIESSFLTSTPWSAFCAHCR